MPIAMKKMIEEIYGSSVAKLSTAEVAERGILVSTNKEVLTMNNHIIETLPDQSYTYLSYDQAMSEDPNDIHNYPPEFFNAKMPSSLPPHVLTLKKGAIIMLLRNIRPAVGFSNGTRLKVLRLSMESKQKLFPKLFVAPSITYSEWI